MIPPVQKLVLGTATLGLTGTREDAFRLLDAFVDLGGTIIDTAAVYNDWVPGEIGRAETILGEWRRRRPRRDGLMICTKGGHPPLADATRSRLDASSIAEDVELSLRRLGVDCLDLFYLHRDDPARPVEGILAPLRHLLDTGKIAAVGLSNWTSARVVAARRAGVVPIASNQVLGNVLCRHMSPPADPTLALLDGPALRDAEEAGTSLFLFSSQCGGYLSKRLQEADTGPNEYRNPAATKAAASIAEVASGLQIDPTALAIGFLLHFSPNIFPVIGSRTPSQLRRSMQAESVRLDATEVAELASISGFSAWR